MKTSSNQQPMFNLTRIQSWGLRTETSSFTDIVLDPKRNSTPRQSLSQSSGFTFGFQQRQDVAFADWALDVADDLAVLFADEFHLHLGTLALGTGTAEDLDDASQNDGLIHDFFGILTEHTCDH